MFVFVRFVVVRNSGGPLPTGRISFDDEQFDNRNGFNPSYGIFTVPLDGTYLFFFSSHTQGIETHLDVYVNGERRKYFWDKDDSNNSRQFTFYLSLELNRDDKLWLDNQGASSLFSDSDWPMTFLGYRLNDEK